MNFKELIEQLKLNEEVENEMSENYREDWLRSGEKATTKNKVNFEFSMYMLHRAKGEAYHEAVDLIEEWYEEISQVSPIE